jgi:hypothetical protein
MNLTSFYAPDPIQFVSQSRGARPNRNRNDLLPFEILGAIFHHVPKHSPFDLRSLLFVCKSWHNAVCQHPSLWPDITLDHTTYTNFVVDDIFQESLAAGYLRCCLKSSRTMPLDVTLRFVWPNFELLAGSARESEIHKEARLVLLLRLLVGEEGEHFPRWHSFTWQAISATNVVTALSILPSTLPNLRTVKLFNVYNLSYPMKAFPSCPNLQTVELLQYCRLLLHETDCAQVTELTLGTDTGWIDEDVEVLCKFGNLRRLTLCALPNLGYSAPESSTIKTEVLFPYLHSLKLQGNPAQHLLLLIKAPVLKDVEFDNITASNVFKYASFASIVETVHIMDTTDCQESATPATISKCAMHLLTFAPYLQ